MYELSREMARGLHNQEKDPSKSHMSLISHILQHLEEDITELEDGGMSVLLSVRDKIIELSTVTENESTEQRKRKGVR